MKIGFIGGGNMASSLMSGIISSGVSSADIFLFDIDSEKCRKWKAEGVNIAENIVDVEKNIASNPIKEANNILNNINTNNENSNNINPSESLETKNINKGYAVYLNVQNTDKYNGIEQSYPFPIETPTSKDAKLIYPDLTDRYIPCAECGKYLPIGNITKSLPENIICDGTCGEVSDYSRYMYSDLFSFSYDEICEKLANNTSSANIEINEDNTPDFNIEEQNVNPDNSDNNLPEETYDLNDLEIHTIYD